jgi:phosphatidylglycerol:prolipoprotein diacylglycerol transferase
MRPELFRIFDVPFHSYRVMLAVAFLACTLLAVRESARRGEGFVIPPATGVWALLGALLGAKAWWAVQYTAPRQWWRALLLWEGGLVFYGGLLGGTLAVALYLRREKIPLLPAADVMAPYLALGEAITRVGCFLNGCCWGAPSTLPWALRFPRGCAVHLAQVQEGAIPADAQQTVPVHPTQLYMTLGLLAAFVVLKGVLKRKTRPGTVVLAYLLLYGAVRFTVEAFRADSARPLLHMTVSQIVSLGLAAGALALFAARALRRRTPSHQP